MLKYIACVHMCSKRPSMPHIFHAPACALASSLYLYFVVVVVVVYQYQISAVTAKTASRNEAFKATRVRDSIMVGQDKFIMRQTDDAEVGLREDCEEDLPITSTS